MIKKNILGIIIIITTLISIQSCSKWDDIGNASIGIDGEYAFPLMHAHIFIEDIVGELDSSTSITVDDDGLIHLIYNGRYTQKNTNDIFASVPQFPLPIVDTFFTFPYIAPNAMILEEIVLKSANINYFASSSFEEDINLIVEFPEITHPVTGETYKHITDIIYTGTVPIQVGGNADLGDYIIRPDQGEIHVRYIATKASGERVYLDNFYMLFSNFKASYIQGYLGNEVFDLDPDTIEINFFEQWLSGGVVFADPIMEVTVENSFGIPVRSVNNFLNVTLLDGTALPLQNDELDQGIDFNYPTLNEIGEYKVTTFTVHKDNSNIEDLFAVKPVAVNYDFDAWGNPDSDQSIIGFATDSSFFTVQVFVDIPVHLNANEFSVISDIELMTDEEDNGIGFADYAIFKISSENNIPADVGIQLYFKDSTGVVIDSLYDLSFEEIITDHAIIESAGVNADGYSVSTTFNEIEVEIPEHKLDAFKQTDVLGLVTIIDNDGDGQFVRFVDTDDLKIKIGVRAGIKTQ